MTKSQDLSGGTYSATITNTTTGCAVAGLEITIDDDNKNPVVNLSTKTADTYCDGSNNMGDGTLTITISEPGQVFVLANFSVEWYRGTHTIAPGTANANFLYDDAGSVSGASVGSAAILGGNIRTLEGLENGTYTVFITKDNVTDPNEGCETFATFTIGIHRPLSAYRARLCSDFQL